MFNKIKKLFICPFLLPDSQHSAQAKAYYACAIPSARVRAGNILFAIALTFFQQIKNFFTEAETISIQEVFPHQEIMRSIVTQNSSRFTSRRFQIFEDRFLRWDGIPSHPYRRTCLIMQCRVSRYIREMKAVRNEEREIPFLGPLPKMWVENS